MEIREIKEGKRRYLSLLLLADEQESMVERYLDRGWMFLLEEEGAAVGECVVTDEGDGLLELKSLAIDPAWQRRGYGRALVEYAAEKYRGAYSLMQVGTGDSPLTLPFYQACGFRYSHRVEGFFLRYYDHPIYEGGKRLADMIYLRRSLRD